MKPYARGLVVGKFCPLHLGHEWLISQAAENCDELFVISYTKPGFPGYDAECRENWLTARFPVLTIWVVDDERLKSMSEASGIDDFPVLPDDSAPDDEHRHFVAWLCIHLLKTTVDAVFTSEDYGDGFAGVLAGRFGHPVAHVCVDKNRTAIPVSGTLIRTDPYRHRQYLSPMVYASHVRRVAILGGESTGKTTLAEALAAHLNTTWVPEYGRELWERKSGHLDYEDMLHIAHTQVQREEAAIQKAKNWLICDTTPLTTLFYCEAMFNKSSQVLRELALRRYDLTILCVPDFPFIQDGTRQDEAFQTRQHIWYQARLAGIQCVHSRGSLQERLAEMVKYGDFSG